MKKYARIYVLILFVTSFMLLYSCVKDFNYTDKYVGSWAFKYTWLKYDELLYSLRTGDSIFYIGVIYPEPNGYVTIIYSDENSINTKVETNGKILNTCESANHGGSECSGYFEGDSILHYSTYEKTPPNHVQVFSTTLTGRKINKNIIKKAPIAETRAATGITLKGAILCGIVYPDFLQTTVSFEFGTSSNYNGSIGAIGINFTDGYKEINECANLSGLTPGTEYHFRIKAFNSLGTLYGSDKTFTTLRLSDPVSDIDGNVYGTVPIGNQIWMTENLKTTHYKDGTSIPLVIDNSIWISLTAPSYCWNNNDSVTIKNIYGALYNWYTVNTGKLCPLGWHIPTDEEWSTLATYLGGVNLAGGKLKEIGTTHWTNQNIRATNETGFTGLPGGVRSSIDGTFNSNGSAGYWWSSTENDATNAWCWYLSSYASYMGRISIDNKLGFSVRCLKD